MREMYRWSRFDNSSLEGWIGNVIGEDDIGSPFAQFHERLLATEFGNVPHSCTRPRNGSAIARSVHFEQQAKFVAGVRECPN